MLSKKNIFFYSLIFFGIYCSVFIGASYDEFFHHDNGERRLKYLLSFGVFEYYEILHFRYYPGLYDTLSYFLSIAFPLKFKIEVFHLINFLISLSSIIALTKVVKIFFDKKISYIFFLLTFFNPIFFGHMSINSKDTVIACANFWILYYIIRYFKSQSHNSKSIISTKLALFLGLGAGVRVVFLGTLIPYLFFIFFEIFYIKKLSKGINLKLFYSHIFKIFLISYFLVILCWPNAHENIFTQPFLLIKESLSDLSQGVQGSLFAGIFYETESTPWYYLFINFFFKLPIIIVFSFLLSIIFSYKINAFYKGTIKNFTYKFLLCFFFMLLPILTAILFNLKMHDGLRYFLYLIPFFNIPIALYLFYLYKNKVFFFNKILIIFLSTLFIFFTFNFIKITPYHYSYLNYFNKIFLTNNSFENDYWGTSLKELVYKFSKSDNLVNNPKIAVCGANPHVIDFYLNKYGVSNYQKTDINKVFDYAFIINRTLTVKDAITNKTLFSSCFTKFKNNKNFLSIKKNNSVLSKIVIK